VAEKKIDKKVKEEARSKKKVAGETRPEDALSFEEAGRQKKPKAKAWSKRKKVLVITCVVVGGIIFLLLCGMSALLIINTPERLEARLLPKIAGMVNGEVTYTGIHLSLFPRQEVVIEGLVLSPSDQSSSATADELQLGLRLFPLIVGDLSVSRITLVNAELPLYRDQGALSLAHCFPREQSLTKMSYKGKLELVDSRVRLEDKSRWSFTWEGADFSGDFNLNPDNDSSFKAELSWEHLVISNSKSMEPSPFAGFAGSMQVLGKYRHDQGKIEFPAIKLNLEGAELSARGEIDDLGTDVVTCSFQFSGEETAVEGISKLFNPRRYGVLDRVKLTGKADVDLIISAEIPGGKGFKNIALIGTMDLYECRLESLPDSGGIGSAESLQGKMVFEEGHVSLSNFYCSTVGGECVGSLDLYLKGEPRLVGKFRGDFDAGLLSALAGGKPGWQVSGSAKGEIDLDGGVRGITDFAYTGYLQDIQGQFYLSPFLAPCIVKSGRLEMMGYELRLIDGSLTLGESPITVNGTLKGFEYPRINYAVYSPSLDLEAVLKESQGGGETPSSSTEAPIPEEGKVTLEGQYTIDKLTLWKIPVERFNATTTYNSGVLQLNSFECIAYGGAMRGKASIQLKERAYTFQLESNYVEIAKWFKENTEKYKEVVSGGRLSVDMLFTARGTNADEVKKSITGEGDFKFERGTVANLHILDSLAEWSGVAVLSGFFIDKLESAFDIGEGRINIREATLSGPDIYQSAINGYLGFDGQVAFSVALRLSPEATNQYYSSAISMAKDSQGRGGMAFLISGTLEEPRFKLDAEATARLATESVGEVSEKGLARFQKDEELLKQEKPGSEGIF
jgi:hypothetical protein